MNDKRTTEDLFISLDQHIQDQNYKKVLQSANEILDKIVNDRDAQKCKIIALIQLQEFDNCLDVIKNVQNGEEEYFFERLYCLYRQKKLLEAEKLILTKNITENTKLKTLYAQILFKLDKYQECVKIYEELMNEEEDITGELVSNLCAAYISCGQNEKAIELFKKQQELTEETFELGYNVACAFLEIKNYVDAQKNLEKSIVNCKKALSDVSQEELNEELSVLLTLLAYSKQLQGNDEESKETYEKIIEQKPSDKSVISICLNNIVATEKGSLFDLLKKINHARTPEMTEQLPTKTKKALAYNQILILLKMEKINECEKYLKKMVEEFSESVETHLLNVFITSLINKEEANNKMNDVRNKFFGDVLVTICAAQMKINDNNFIDAINILLSLNDDLKFKPALLSTLVNLYISIGDTKNCCLLFDSAEKYWSLLYDKDPKNVELENIFLHVLKFSAKFKFDHSLFQEASKSYEKILRVKRGDVDGLANYIISTSKFDPMAAEQYEDKLPPIDGFEKVNVENLVKELTSVSRVHVVTPISSSSSSSTTTITDVNQQQQKKKKKKKKKKVRYPKNVDPKNIDPNAKIDPERWLPLKERSYFKDKKRSKKGSAQGEVQRTTTIKIEVNNKVAPNKKKRNKK